MSDPPPPLPLPWPASDPPKKRRVGQWFFTASGTIILVLTLVVGAPVLLMMGCIFFLSGDKAVGLIVGLVIALVALGGFLLWLGLRRPKQ
jgi:hypothetical protein